MIAVKRALLSVSDKRGVVDLARGLARCGAEILSTGGTAKAISDAGVSVTEISTVTGVPEMLGGRVKTLHPAVHAGDPLRRGRSADEAAMAAHGFGPIDLVAVNLYPFEAAAARNGALRAEVIEEIDIGGPTLLRSAAKNHDHVVALCDPDDYLAVLDEIEKSGGVSKERAAALALKVFERTSGYDAAIAAWMWGATTAGGGTPAAKSAGVAEDASARRELPETLEIRARRVRSLRYGENPHQPAGYFAEAGRSEPWRQMGGKDLSYNNLLDLEAGRALLAEFDGTAAIVVKHNNPCGAAVAPSLEEAVHRALAGDPLSAFGGIVLVNEPLDEASAELLTGIFLEVVAAPAFEAGALEALAKKEKNLVRLVLAPYEAPAVAVRSALGGWLGQTPDPPGGLPGEARCVTKREPTGEERRDLDFAWRLCKHVRSNAIVLVRDRMLLGAGAGQQSRIDSVEVSLMKAGRCGHETRGSVLASDAFFPFRDSIDRAAAAGVRAVAEPGGSVRDAESIAAADDAGIAMLFTGRRAFRH